MKEIARAIPRLVLGGVSSGVGKTTLTVAIARALLARGLRVAIFKCGPDYLDPTYHARAVGHATHNLDGWMMGCRAVRATFVEATRDADVALIEGAMGLFDGATPTSDEGSTAEIAKWLESPVILVVDASAMARSIAAVVDGFARFDPDLRVVGAIANRVGGRGHADLLREALAAPAATPLFGALPLELARAFPERHLGLRIADEAAVPDALLDHWGARAAEWLDLDALLDVARSAPQIIDDGAISNEKNRPSRVRIGVAYDEAFHFYYVDNLRRLESLGAELVRFSPVHDRVVPDVDGLILGGGYPEAHASALAENASMRASIAAFAERGAPIYAECGGLMYLTRAIRTLDGARHEMVGLLPTEARMHARLQAIGYVDVETLSSSALGPRGTRFRGHQFRYSELDPPPIDEEFEPAYAIRRRHGGAVTSDGFAAGEPVGTIVASYVHAHWASNPSVAEAFVEACVRATRSAR